MTFTPPDLSEVLTNEQTMNSRLTTCRNDLRAILTKEEIGYTTIYRDKLIDLLSKDRNGNERYCNIREYIMSENGPKERLSEFFCNLMEDDREILDNIYNRLPIEVTNENANQHLDQNINSSRKIVEVCSAILGFGFFSYWTVNLGRNIVNKKVNNSKREGTVEAIKNSFKSSIEIMTKK